MNTNWGDTNFGRPFMTPQLLLLFWREITLLGFLQVLECEKSRSIILTLRLGLDFVDDGTAIDYLGGTLLAFQPRPVTLAPLPSYHTSGGEFKSSKESRKYMKWTHHKTLQSLVHFSCNRNNQKMAIYCPQGSGTLRQQLLMMHW